MADAAVLLRPLGARILEALAKPQSAAGIGRTLDVARQKVGYHLKELEKQGLVELVEEKKVSAAYVIAVAARALREVTRLRQAADDAGKRLVTLTLETEIRFATAAQPATAQCLTDYCCSRFRIWIASSPGGPQLNRSPCHRECRRGYAARSSVTTRTTDCLVRDVDDRGVLHQHPQLAVSRRRRSGRYLATSQRAFTASPVGDARHRPPARQHQLRDPRPPMLQEPAVARPSSA
jgi:DNA-binding transcriptional ArsR family regulator